MRIPVASGDLSATNPRKWRTSARNRGQRPLNSASMVAIFVTG